MDKSLSLKDLSTRLLLDGLTEGWRHSHSGAALEFVSRWAAALKATFEVMGVGDDSLSFTLELGSIRLRGMNSKPCLLLADAEGESWLEELRRQTSPHQIPFILTLSDAAYERAKGALHGDLFLILSKEDILQIIENSDPLAALKQALVGRIPRRALVPYNILTPAEGNMFFGRSRELEHLHYDHFSSFAIAGPGRIGKTSLLRNYKTLKIRQGALRRSPLFFVSFYNCAPNEDSIARFLAMQIDSSKRSDRMTPDGLLDFLKYHANRYGAPLELLLDEVDEVCESNTFQALGAAARTGVCRLILSGRGSLLKMMLSRHSPLDCRLDLMRLEPLDEPAARALLMQPLRDMGFEVPEADALAEEIMSLTGLLPYLLQFVCRTLVNCALAEETNVISARHMEHIRGDFLTAQYFLKPLSELADPQTRLVALLMLARGQSTFTVQTVKEDVAEAGLKLDYQRAEEICNGLVINNVLSWKGTAYGVASKGLYYYAREFGYFDSALKEAIEAVKSSRH